MAETIIVPIILIDSSGAGLGLLSCQPTPPTLESREEGASPLQIAATSFAAAPIVACPAEHCLMVTEQLARVGVTPRAVLLDSGGNGNAPALVAALLTVEASEQALVLVFSGLSAPLDAAILRQAAAAALPSAHAGMAVGLGGANGGRATGVLARAVTLLGRCASRAPTLVEACRHAMADSRQDGPLVYLATQAYGSELAAMVEAATRPDKTVFWPATDSACTERPWGRFHSIDRGERFQVKHIEVDPGAKLSLQKHWHRSEHWVVVAGTALVTNGDSTFLLRENQATFIPAATIHRLENPGMIPLRLIEVQSGEYVGEDDIVRLEDSYGR